MARPTLKDEQGNERVPISLVIHASDVALLETMTADSDLTRPQLIRRAVRLLHQVKQGEKMILDAHRVKSVEFHNSDSKPAQRG